MRTHGGVLVHSTVLHACCAQVQLAGVVSFWEQRSESLNPSICTAGYMGSLVACNTP